MIAVRLVGRLGNQMFQYATARALALRLGVGIGLDTRYYSLRRRRDLTILFLNLRTEPISKPDLPPKETRRFRIFGRKHRNRFKIFSETQHTFDETVQMLSDWTYLLGCFQNEKYFLNYASEIREELGGFPEIGKQNREILKAIEGSDSVSIHARRGDYAGNIHYDLLPPTYYADAVHRILDTITGTPQFFVFSDDPDWAEANIRPPTGRTTYVRNTGPAYEDLRLMSHCKHHIIANSSFSWWAAWLRYSTDKTVIAPRVWLNIPGFDASDVVPAYWTRI